MYFVIPTKGLCRVLVYIELYTTSTDSCEYSIESIVVVRVGGIVNKIKIDYVASRSSVIGLQNVKTRGIVRREL